MKTVDKDSLEESLSSLVPQLVTEPGKVSVQILDEWLDSEEEMTPLTVLDVFIYTESGRFKANYRTFKSLLGSLYIQEQLIKMVAPSLLESLVNSLLQEIPANKGPSFVIDDQDVATDVVRRAGVLPVYLTEAVEHMSKCFAFSVTGSEDTTDIEYLPLVHEDNTSKIFTVNKKIKVTIFGDIWYGGVALAHSSSGRLVPNLTYFMVREYDNFIITLPGVNLRYSAPKNGSGSTDGLDWLEDAVGMAASVLPSEMENLRHLASRDVEKDLPSIVRDILKTVQLPQGQRAQVVADVIEDYSNWSAYGLMVSVGSAQLTEELSFAILDKTQQAAGKVPSVLGHRCDHCHQLVE